MSTSLTTQLADVQERIRAIGAQLDEDDYRAQFHEDLSALGWHVGHCSFIETYWLREIAQQDDSMTAELHNLYFPENIAKPKRGPALPKPADHLAWCDELNRQNCSLLETPPARLRTHKLSQDNYLGKFVLQHHVQHLETMFMVLQQRALKRHNSSFIVTQPLMANAALPETVQLHSGAYRIGSEHESVAFDNELPPHSVELAHSHIACRPVTNAAWLAFMLDGGYANKQWWSAAGWQWCEQSQASKPEHWQQDENHNCFGLDHDGAHMLQANDPVYGVNHYEAQAFSHWLAKRHAVKARLLHEYEWEAAQRSGLLAETGRVWEWCGNTFHAYKGFTAFPYDNYSKTWFDDKHYVLRGGSMHSHDIIKRPSFRNFYNPDKRHIFAGTRIAIDD
jgi:iron(II)-dependent oxidoreductase